jgi:predicted alpha/beta hydrolase family esterase
MSKDFEATEASYTDTVVESWISQAERLVNKLKGHTCTAGLITHTAEATGEGPEFVAGTLMIAKHIAHNQMIDDGIMDRNNPPNRVPLIDDDVLIAMNIQDKDFFGAGTKDERGI